MPTFGRTGGADTAINASNYLLWSNFASTGTGVAIKLSIYAQTVVGTTTVKCALYDNSRYLIVATGSNTITTVLQWYDFNFVPPPDVINGTNYNLVIWLGSEGAVQVSGSTTISNTRGYARTFNDWPAQLSPGNAIAMELLIYCTYSTTYIPPRIILTGNITW